MDSFDTLDEMWLAAGAGLIQDGVGTDSRDGGVYREQLGYCARLLNPAACFMLNPVRKASMSYAAAEFLWYLSGTTDASMMIAYASQYSRFTDDGINAYGAYGARWAWDPAMRTVLSHPPEAFKPLREKHYQRVGEKFRPTNQLDVLIMLLNEKPATRQAVMSMWNAGDLVHALVGGKADLPCSLVLNFHVRENKLNLIATMRSNDIWLGMPYDVFCFCSLQRLIADVLDMELGFYQHQAGSLHVYERNAPKFEAALNPGSFDVSTVDYQQPTYKLNDDLKEALYLERYHRENKIFNTNFKGVNSLLGQMVVMAATKWDNSAYLSLGTKQLVKYQEKLQCS